MFLIRTKHFNRVLFCFLDILFLFLDNYIVLSAQKCANVQQHTTITITILSKSPHIFQNEWFLLPCQDSRCTEPCPRYNTNAAVFHCVLCVKPLFFLQTEVESLWPKSSSFLSSEHNTHTHYCMNNLPPACSEHTQVWHHLLEKNVKNLLNDLKEMQNFIRSLMILSITVSRI